MKIKFNPGLLILLILFTLKLSAQEDYNYTLSNDSLVNFYASQKRVYYATRTELKPKIDGKLDDECWLQGEWSAGFRQQQPAQAQPPSQETEIKILYDNQNLYIAMLCHDNEPEKIRPILGRRDDFTSGDVAGVALDTYFDKRTAFEFNVSAAGQKIDLMHLGAYQWDTNWDAVWDGKASVGDSAWFVEMRVPFSQVRFAKKDEHIWGMHIWRWIDRLDEEDQWKLIPIDAPAMVYIFGELRGIEGIQNKRNFEVLPYAKAKYITDANNNERFGFGLDGKIGVTSDFTLDYTVNPDFGQVEADPSELNLTSYEVFYDEKRPFFLEGNSILEYDMDDDLLFYSRRIGHAPSYSPNVSEDQKLSIPDNTSILNAIKLTGKSHKGLSVGIINSMTSKEFATVTEDGIDTKYAAEPFTNYFISRIKQDYNNGNTVIGGMFTSTLRSIKDEQLEFLPEKSTVGGINFQHNWANRKYFIDLKTFYSNIRGSETAISSLQLNSRHLFQRVDADYLNYDPDKTVLEGWGGQLSGGKQSGKFRISDVLSWRSPGVDFNDLGYLRQADYIRNAFMLRYQVNEPKGILRNYYVTSAYIHDWSWGGENIYNKFDNHAFIKFKNLWSLHLDFDRYFHFLDTRQLRGGPALRIDDMSSFEFFVQTNSAKDIFLGFGSNMDWYDQKISSSNDYTFYACFQIGDNFTITSNTVFEKTIDNNQFITKQKVENDYKYLVGKIDRKTLYTTLRMEYFITPELSLQFYGSPYTSTGKYLDYKEVANAQSANLNEKYTMLSKTAEGVEQVSLSNQKSRSVYTISKPDFNFRELRSNFVARWEFRPGSTLYFVWTHSRSQEDNVYNNSIIDSFNGIFDVKPQNAFMIKLSYWFSL
ncbi:MAG: carbohydrate binding family 9 domain-containing protein [Prolixibacteraceae bacterium]|nr:carbohydrate binding family 9 domain-containing protein [Prolixibacteraceae bacterium]MBN2775948.1 carbohydrate binding family 9 domain-containing protein [Prolixibacteraceae bacterium]